MKQVIAQVFKGAGLNQYLQDLLKPESLIKKVIPKLGQNEEMQIEETEGPENSDPSRDGF